MKNMKKFNRHFVIEYKLSVDPLTLLEQKSNWVRVNPTYYTDESTARGEAIRYGEIFKYHSVRVRELSKFIIFILWFFERIPYPFND